MKKEELIIKEWETPITNRAEKEIIAGRIAQKVTEGDVIGVGSGSTSYLALLAISRRIHAERLSVMVIPTSLEMTFFCQQLNVPLTTLGEHTPDWSFDGADEVDPENNLIKGRGGAMFKEKLIIRSSPKSYIIIDKSKQVEKLGQRYPIPIEVYPMALPYVEKELKGFMPQSIKLRTGQGKDGPVITENGNLILDVWFNQIPHYLENSLKSITGIIESGLFQHYKNIEVISAPVGR